MKRLAKTMRSTGTLMDHRCGLFFFLCVCVCVRVYV